MNVLKSIRAGLSKTGGNQRWLSEATGLSEQYVSMIVTGKKGVGVQTIEKLAAAFGVSVSEFIKWGE